MLVKKARLRTLEESEQLALRGSLHRPWIDLAERVGYLQSPYEDLRSLQGGFSDQMRFIVMLARDGDVEAQRLRDDIRDANRYWLLGQGPFPEGFGARRVRFLEAHQKALTALQKEHSPWLFSTGKSGWTGEDFSAPQQDAEQKFSRRVLSVLEPYGFSSEQVRSGKKFWRCWSVVADVRVELDVDKGSHGVDYTASWTLPELGVSWHLALPFFFSGGSFLASRAHPFELQLDRFFTAYEIVMPDVWRALTESVRSATKFLV
jgi:hypothetical protein